MLAIFSKELKSYFYTLTGYIFLGTFLLFSGILFSLLNLLQANNDYNNVISNLVFILLLLVPILTMKIISEETKSRTDQLLLTSPVKLSYIIVGKYLGALALFSIAILITFSYPIILRRFSPVPYTEILAAYVGLFLIGSTFIAIGIFISSLTENQVISAVITFGVLLFIWILDSIIQDLPVTRLSGIIFVIILAALFSFVIYTATKDYFALAVSFILGMIIIISIYFYKKEMYEGFIVRFFSWFSLINRFNIFTLGVISLNSIVYYISFSIAFIFFTIRILEKKRWS
jgi:ABC-2 type transport system permease protein